MAAQMLDVDDFMVELMDSDEEDINKLVDFAGEIVVAYLEDLVDNGLELVIIPEPVASGELIRPSDFEKYVIPADIKGRLVGRCPNCLIHVCGRGEVTVF